MYDFYTQFEEYCKTPGIDSGKVRSYSKAIEYLCDYLKIFEIDAQAVAKIKHIENDICNKRSEMYEDLLLFLTRRGQKSYLAKDYIKAALRYFLNLLNNFTQSNR